MISMIPLDIIFYIGLTIFGVSFALPITWVVVLEYLNEKKQRKKIHITLPKDLSDKHKTKCTYSRNFIGGMNHD